MQSKTNPQPDPADIRQHRLRLCWVRNAADTRPRQEELTLDDLAERWSRPDLGRGTLTLNEYHALNKANPADKKTRNREKDGEAFIPAIFSSAGVRDAKSVTALHGFVFDFDGGVTEGGNRAEAAGYAYIAYTSYSHRPEDERLRVFIPYLAPIAPQEHARVVAWAEGIFAERFNARSRPSTSSGIPPLVRRTQAISTCPGSTRRRSSTRDNCPCRIGVGRPDRAAAPSKKLGMFSAGSSAALHPVRRPDNLDQGRHGSLQRPWERRPPPGWNGQRRHRNMIRTTPSKTWVASSVSRTVSAPVRSSTFHGIRMDRLEPVVGDSADITEINRDHFMARENGKTLVFRETTEPVSGFRRIQRLQPQNAPDYYRNRTVQASARGGNHRTKIVGLGDHWLSHPDRRTYEEVIFTPNHDAPGCYNLWQGFTVNPAPGDWSLLQAHIREVICSANAEWPITLQSGWPSPSSIRTSLRR